MPDTPDPNDAIRAAVDAITAPPPIDPAPPLDLAASTRQQIVAGIDDPSSVYWRRRDLLDAHDRDVAVLLARHSIVPPPVETPQRRAARELDASFASFGRELEPHLQAAIDADVEAIERMPPADQERRATDLRREYGADYDRLVEQAKAAGDWKPAVALSRLALVLLAGVGRYRQSYAREKGRLGA